MLACPFDDRILFKTLAEQFQGNNYAFVGFSFEINLFISPMNSGHLRKKLKNVRFAQWNVCGLRSKFAELITKIIPKFDLDVILIQETRLKRTANTPNVPGFQSYYLPRDHGIGGGLLALGFKTSC